MDVVSRVKLVSKEVAEGLNRLVENGLDSENIHIVGHSLGGQVAGFLAGFVNFIIPRITGI